MADGVRAHKQKLPSRSSGVLRSGVTVAAVNAPCVIPLSLYFNEKQLPADSGPVLDGALAPIPREWHRLTIGKNDAGSVLEAVGRVVEGRTACKVGQRPLSRLRRKG